MRRAAAAFLFLALIACGGGGSDTSENSGLSITISGLPAGADADILVSGPAGFNRSVIATQTLTNVPAGTYTVTAGSVVNANSVFTPRVPSQVVTLASGSSASAAIAYDPNGSVRLGLQQLPAAVTAPTFLTAPPGDARLFILERAGRIRLFKNNALLATPVLDISARVSTDGERGLLSMAFDPQFATNGFFYIYFTEVNTGNVLVERFQMQSTNPDVATNAPLRILTVPHSTFNNHNGGHLAFGTDGFLYVSIGDGGGGGDPSNNGQNLNTLLGKMLRLDVANASLAQPYAIPFGNPFAGQSGRRAEIWAYGLRNPWRYAFDTSRGLLYIADVGQDAHEEVDVASATAAGLNYGWNIMEGTACFTSANCQMTGLTLPVLEYLHGTGACSVIGGFVYRGSAIPELRGRFFYSDLCGGFLRSFRAGGSVAAEQIDWGIGNFGQVVSFGEDAAGEMYFITATNIIYKIVRQ